MKKIIVFLAVSIIAAVGLRAQETKMLKVKVQAAIVRAEPDMNSSVVKQLNLGVVLESRQKIGDWFEIVVTDDRGATISGYISSSVVDVVSPVAAKPAPQPSPPPAPGIPLTRPSAMIFGRYGSFAPSDAIFKTVYGSGSVLGGEIRFRVAGGFYLSLEGGYFNKKGLLTVTRDETTMTIYPIDAMLIFHALSGSIMPYVGAGGAGCKYQEKNAIGTVDGWGYGFAVCGGLSARLSFLGIDARVKYTSIKIKPLEDEAGLGGLTLSLAAGIIF